MNAYEELLMFLQDGTPYSFAQIIDLTGMVEQTARNALGQLTKSGLLAAQPVTYRVTPQAESAILAVQQGGRLSEDGRIRA